jgi:hypothetical protein
LAGKLETPKVQFDTSNTDEMFGTRWIVFEEQVKDLLGHYLEVSSVRV